jgi:hypothetical protein
VRVFVDPAADSLGVAWGAVYAPLVEPASAIPAGLRSALPYPVTWFEAQLEVLEEPSWGLGRRPSGAGPAGGMPPGPVWGADGPLLQAMFEDPARGSPATLVEAGRRGGEAVLTIDRLADRNAPGAEELSRSWSRMPALGRLRDSVRAAGDTVLAGAVRWQDTPAGMVAWQAFRSGGRRGVPSVLWIATARGTAIGGARRPQLAWAALGRDEGSASGDAPIDAVSRLEAIRAWVARADSALARRDMTAFGRAWEALRGLLAEPSHK